MQGQPPFHPQGEHELEPLRLALSLRHELQRDGLRGGCLYGYEDGGYTTVRPTTKAVELCRATSPPGDAVFTQTATLGERETFGVSLPQGKSSEAYALTRSLALYLASTDAATRSLTADADRLQVNAVEADEAVADFDPMADGVKWDGSRRADAPALRRARCGPLFAALRRQSRRHVGSGLPRGPGRQLTR